MYTFYELLLPSFCFDVYLEIINKNRASMMNCALNFLFCFYPAMPCNTQIFPWKQMDLFYYILFVFSYGLHFYELKNLKRKAQWYYIRSVCYILLTYQQNVFHGSHCVTILLTYCGDDKKSVETWSFLLFPNLIFLHFTNKFVTLLWLQQRQFVLCRIENNTF